MKSDFLSYVIHSNYLCYANIYLVLEAQLGISWHHKPLPMQLFPFYTSCFSSCWTLCICWEGQISWHLSTGTRDNRNIGNIRRHIPKHFVHLQIIKWCAKCLTVPVSLAIPQRKYWKNIRLIYTGLFQKLSEPFEHRLLTQKMRNIKCNCVKFLQIHWIVKLYTAVWTSLIIV